MSLLVSRLPSPVVMLADGSSKDIDDCTTDELVKSGYSRYCGDIELVEYIRSTDPRFGGRPGDHDVQMALLELMDRCDYSTVDQLTSLLAESGYAAATRHSRQASGRLSGTRTTQTDCGRFAGRSQWHG